ncbi:MAG: hypothetical protein Q8928_18635, partial [Bacteroidota bacterium]|nr:hypothetical protein [Bacteroidota bacterium]
DSTNLVTAQTNLSAAITTEKNRAVGIENNLSNRINADSTNLVAEIARATTAEGTKIQIGGDLSGTITSPTVAKIKGASLGTTTATDKNILVADGTQWNSVAMSGDITIDNTGKVSIGAGKIIHSMLAADAVEGGPGGNIKANSITQGDIGSDAIGSGEIQAGAVGTSELKDANVTYTKIQNISASNKVLGRVSSGAGVIEEISTTGSGNVVRATSPTLTTPTLGDASATTVNKVTITQPSTSATLTITDGKTLIVSNDANVSGTNTGDQTTITGNAGSATKLETTRSIYGNSFNGTADLTQIIASTYGGTGNGFTKFTGPSISEKTFTLPDASATILTTNTVVTGAQGGTGINNNGKTITLGGNLTTSGASDLTFTTTGNTTVTLPTTGTLATTSNKLSAFAATSSTELAGIISDETGTGAAVFAISPSFTTPNIGAASGTSLNLSVLTASRPLKTDASKNLVSGSIDLSSSNDVTNTLLVANGGTGTTTLNNHGVLIGSGTSAVSVTATGLAGQILQSGGAATNPSYSTATYPSTTTNNQLLYSSSNNTIVGLSTANGGILNTNSLGTPVITATPTLGVVGSTLGTIALAGNTSGAVTITPQATAGTYNFNLPSTAGTNGQVLKSGGGGANPMTWEDDYTYIRKLTDETKNNNTSLSNDGTLTFPVIAGNNYSFSILVYYATGSSPDFKFDIYGGGTITASSIRIIKESFISGGAYTTSIDNALAQSTSITGNTGNGFVRITGILQSVTTGGTISFRWAQNSSSGTSTTVYAGSYVQFSKF